MSIGLQNNTQYPFWYHTKNFEQILWLIWPEFSAWRQWTEGNILMNLVCNWIPHKGISVDIVLPLNRRLNTRFLCTFYNRKTSDNWQKASRFVKIRIILIFNLLCYMHDVQNHPSARCASAANVCRNVNVFRNKEISLNHVL
jgi:hypothetical protein